MPLDKSVPIASRFMCLDAAVQPRKASEAVMVSLYSKFRSDISVRLGE